MIPELRLGDLCFGGGGGDDQKPETTKSQGFFILLFEVLCVIDFYTEKEQVIK